MISRMSGAPIVLLALGGLAACGDPSGEYTDPGSPGDGVFASGLVNLDDDISPADTESYAWRDGWLVSATADALEAGDRFAMAVELRDAEGASPLIEIQAIAADGEEGEWTPVTWLWREDEFIVGGVDVSPETVAVAHRIAGADVEQIVTLEWSLTRSEVEAEQAAVDVGVGEASQPLLSRLSNAGVRSRGAWGAAATRCTSVNSSKYRMAIHHTVTPQKRNGSYDQMVRWTQSFHMNGRGWCDVGYHFLVTANGKVYEGRPLHLIGAHVGGNNTGNIGISLVGCFDGSCGASYGGTSVPRAMFNGAARIVSVLSDIYNIPIDASHVKGHRDHSGQGTSCPGSKMHPRLGELRGVARNGVSTPDPDICKASKKNTCQRAGCGCRRDACSCPGNGSDHVWYFNATRGQYTSKQRRVNNYAVAKAGDFNGDGRDDMLFYGPGPESDRIWYGRGDRRFNRVDKNIGSGKLKPVIADFDNDGRDDVFFHGPGSVADFYWFGKPTRGQFQRKNVSFNGNYRPLIGDFNGDGHDDVFLYGVGTRYDALRLGRGNNLTPRTGPSVTVNGRYRTGVGDFDGDGFDDILWYKPGSGADYVWFGSADGTFTDKRLGAIGGDRSLRIGDFDGDGKDDVFFYQRGQGNDAVFYGRGNRTFARDNSIDINGRYHPFVGDFDGDGRHDVFLYQAGSGTDRLWFGKENRSFARGTTYQVNGRYKPRVGDFDGDGRDDIFWYGPGPG